MLKVLVDFLILNWVILQQAPLSFILAILLGFVIGAIFLKNQNDALRERLMLRDEQAIQKDTEIKTLTSELEALRKEKEALLLSRDFQSNDYEKYLEQLSTPALSQEAQKMSRNIEKSVRNTEKRQDLDMRSMHLEVGLYNEWLAEGPRLLAIKYEALKRLPEDTRLKLDQISNSRYTGPAFQVDSIMDAVLEIKNIGLALAENDNPNLN